MTEGETRHAESPRSSINRIMRMNYILMAIIVVMLAFIIYILLGYYGRTPATTTTATTVPPVPANVSESGFGHTIAGINRPFNSTELSIINGAPNSYYEIAAKMLLNGTLTNYVWNRPVNSSTTTNGFVVGGRPSVVYIGALSCIYCGENRWAMALALSRFGSFGSLYYGYSSFGDGDLPTIYWEPYNYTTSAGVAYGNGYSSNVVNFISADYESPVTQNFQLQPMGYFISHAPNGTVANAIEFMNETRMFQGTPFTLWGNYLMPGADAVVFGNYMPKNSTLPLEYMTHSQVLGQLAGFDSQFAYSEYAAADVYAAFVCASTANRPQFCSLPSMPALESLLGLS